MPRAIRKVAKEYDILGEYVVLAPKKPKYKGQPVSGIYDYLVEQKPTKKRYYYDQNAYDIALPWMYYVMRKTLIQSPSYFSTYSIPVAFMMTSPLKANRNSVIKPYLTNFVENGFTPCARSYSFKWDGKKIDTKDMVQLTYTNFWQQNGNDEGIECGSEPWRQAAELAGTNCCDKEGILTWLEEQTVEDVLAIKWPTEAFSTMSKNMKILTEHVGALNAKAA